MTTNLIDSLTANRVYTLLDQDAEAAMLARAKGGDQDATKVIIDNYLGTLVNEVDRVVRKAGGFIENSVEAREDAMTDAILVLYRVIDKFRPGRGRFGGLLKTALRNDPTLTMVMNRTRAMTVPRATMDRRAAAIRAAEGDVEKARELAPQFGMTRETFDAIAQVIQSNNTLNPDLGEEHGGPDTTRGAGDVNGVGLEMTEPEYVRIEDLHDARAALSVLDPDEYRVICGLYGLEGWPEHSQYELAADLGVSRQTVRRLRDAAMLKMQAHFQDKE